MMDPEHPCARGLTPECFEAYPEDAIKAFAYRLLNTLFPSNITRRLPRIFRPKAYDWGLMWLPWLYYIFEDWLLLDEPLPEDWKPGDPLPPGEIIQPGGDLPPGWTPGDPLPPSVVVDPGVVFPPGWDPSQPLPPGVVIDPGVVFPPGWTPGDPLPPGIIVDPGVVFPPGWTPGMPLPPGVVVPPGVVFPPGWTPGDPLPPGVTLPPGVAFPPGWTPGDPLPPGVVADPAAVFPPGWTPGAGGLPPGITPGEIPGPTRLKGWLSPLYVGIFEPGPVHRPSDVWAGVDLLTTLYAETDCQIKNYQTTWDNTRNDAAGTGIICDIGISSGNVQAWRGATKHQIRRYFFSVDLSGLPAGATITAVVFRMTQYAAGRCYVSIQEGSQEDIITIADYGEYVDIPWVFGNPYPDWWIFGDPDPANNPFASLYWATGLNDFTLNQDGIDYMQTKIDSVAKFCLREYEHDFYDQQPDVGDNFLAGCYGPTTGDDADKPQFIITYRT